MKKPANISLVLSFILILVCISHISASDKIILKNNWMIQSSSKLKDGGQNISLASFQPNGWYPATMPSTVLAALVENKVYPDPYYGTNFESLPGNVTGRAKIMPEDSPFRVSWWYRTSFDLPAEYAGKHPWLKFHSINYQANIWLNGKLIADTTEIEGAYRLYNLDIAKYALPGNNNCLAIEIFPPQGMDLTITWVDWNPTPPDLGMGIWYDVTIHPTGPVAINNPHVITDLDLPSLDHANLTVTADLYNAEDRTVSGVLKGKIGSVEFLKEVTLLPLEKKPVVFSPADYRQLVFPDPRLWWPHNVGTPYLYDLNLSFETGGMLSDESKTRFGIREISSWMNIFDGKRTRVFQVNGKNIVIRGGGYVQDMMLRPSDERIDTDIRYAKHMNLNALRMEAPRGSDYMFDKCDEEGILLIVGWCCCSPWEQWKNWTSHTADIAEKSWHDQIIHLRNHPSIFTWFLGSDYFPPEDIERRYIKVLDDLDGTRPYQSSATKESSTIAGYTGLEMGPYRKGYSYMPPSYWYGKLEFNTEAGPTGEQISPIESLRKMMPENDLWPISKSWEIRLHKAFYPDAREALYSRYGQPLSVEEYCRKSQLLQLEAVKAMFEAYAGNKYRSSGIICWMYNSAWPALYWQLYDYYFTPNGAFYGAKKACEPLHIQYYYNDSSIKVVNSLYNDFKNLKARIRIFNMNMQEIYSKDIRIENVLADESRQILRMERNDMLSDVFFLKLDLEDSSGKNLSSNFYWLSQKGDENADFKELDKLPEIRLKVSVSRLMISGNKSHMVVSVRNPSSSLAFAINPKIMDKLTGELILPVFWEDNYFPLLPGEKRKVSVEMDNKVLQGKIPYLKMDGWNISPVLKAMK